jgi:uncharacterized protein YndB with AHSA1/START domain
LSQSTLQNVVFAHLLFFVILASLYRQLNHYKLKHMENMENKVTSITVKATVNAPAEKVWKFWTTPEHITKWCNASDDWHTPHAENDPRTGGKFLTRMEAKDGSFGFDFGGVYDEVKTQELISYSLGDGRKVKITFAPSGNGTIVTETFDAEQENPVEMQRTGWQNILDNFKKYVESN